MGLELSGKIYSNGPNASKFDVGTEVMTIVGGGAFAEFCIADERSLMKVPEGFGLKRAAGIPEVWLTAFQLLHLVGRVKAGDTVLIHAAASGVGTSAIQLAKQAGAQTIIATTSEKKLAVCKVIGASHAFDRRGKWEEEILKLGKPVDLVLDCVGGPYADQNLKVLGIDARWVLYGLMGGSSPPESLFRQILGKRISILPSTLRSRSEEYKGMLAQEFVKSGALELLRSGEMKTVLDEKSFKGLENVEAALDYMETDVSVGKIILEVE